MNRRTFCQLASLPLAAQAPQAQRPNIVYILADDMGWGDLGCYNSRSAVPTPNMDRLAAQGMQFTDMHSPSAVCTPTRYGILTGRYCWRSSLKKGVLWGYSPNLIEEGRLTVPALLRSQGYSTAGVGKWHLGLGSMDPVDYSKRWKPSPIDHGFDSYYGIPASLDMDPYVYIENDHAVAPPTSHTDGQTLPRGVFWRAGGMSPDFDFNKVLPHLTEKAIGVIRKQSKPFFLYFPLTAPHTPWLPTAGYQGKSKAGTYGDFVTQVDDSVGAVMKALEEAKLADNTLLIVTSDNGADWKIEDKAKFAHRANADWRGEKADIWDAGHRVPFLARWPGRIAKGAVNNELGCLTDLMATLASVTGAKLPANAGEDSFDLLPAMLGQPHKPARDAIVHHSVLGMFGIRHGEWKLALGLGSGGFSPPATEEPVPNGPIGQLYNLARDPGEKDNLYLKHPEIVARLTALLDRYGKEGRSR